MDKKEKLEGMELELKLQMGKVYEEH